MVKNRHYMEVHQWFPFWRVMKGIDIEFFGRDTTIYIPTLARTVKILYVDYKTEKMAAGIIEDAISKITHGRQDYQIYKREEILYTDITILTIEKEVLDAVVSLIENIPDKVASFYGKSSKESYIKERDQILHVMEDHRK